MNINVLNNQHKFKATHEDLVVSLDKFLYVQDRKNKYILLRFYNGLTNDINSISFDVYFYVKGQVIGVKRMRDVAVRSYAQNCFYFPKKISVPAECDSFAIDNITTRAGFIEYNVKDGQVEKAFYDLSEIPDTAAARNILGAKHIETNVKNSYKTTRVLCLMFAFMVALVIALLPLLVIQQQHDTCETFSLDNISYEFLDDDRDNGQIAVTGYSGTSTVVDIPATIEGLSVAKIADNAFKDNTTIESVYIAGEVEIGKSAFSGCTSLGLIDFGKVSSIGEEAFKDTALTSIDCTNCTYIGSSAFENCKNLDNVSFKSANTLTVGTTPFANCGTINTVSILQNISFENKENTLIFGTTTVQYLSLKSYPFRDEANNYINIANIMPNLSSLYIESIDTIPDEFCMKMVNLQSVTIDYIDNCSVGKNAFSSCKSLTTFDTPALNKIGDNAFNGTGLKEFYFDSLTSIGSGAFKNSEITISLNKCKNLESIGSDAFSGCKGITTLELAQNVEIGTGAFSNCTNLEVVSIPYVTNIPDNAFNGCTSLKTVDIATTLETVGAGAFANTAITKIDLPDTLKSIGIGAYAGTKNVTTINLPFIGGSPTENNYIAYIFGEENYNDVKNETYPQSLKTITVSNAKKIDEGAFALLTHVETINILGSCTTIGKYAFLKCSNLTNVKIPDTVTDIGVSAFSECKNLSKVNLPKGTKYIGDGCFLDCTSLTNIDLSICTSLLSIGVSAFEGTKISTFKIPETVTEIGKGAFKKCPLTEITLPNCISSIDDGDNKSFGYYFGSDSLEDNNSAVPSTLKKITINKGNKILENTFNGLSNVTEIKLPEDTTAIYASAFENCTGLTSFNIPESVKIIETSAFSGCSGITEIEFSSQLEKIGSYAFANCSALNTISFANSGSSKGLTILSNVFENTAITYIKIPTYVVYIGKGILYNTKALETLEIPKLYQVKVTNNVITKTSDIATMGYIFGAENDTFNSSVVPKSLKKVILTDTTEIVDNMFYNVTSLESVEFTNVVTSIGYSSFEGCTSLKNINLENGLKTIERSAFESTGLVNIEIPTTVTSIGYSAFGKCNLESLKMPNCITTHLGKILGIDKYDDNSTKVPATLKTIEITYASSKQNKLPDYMFYGFSNVEKIKLPEKNLTEIGIAAFYGCSSLKSLTIPDTVTTFGKNQDDNYNSYLLVGCSSLESLTIPTLGYKVDDNYRYLAYFFGGAYNSNAEIEGLSLKEVTITKETSIPDYAFYNLPSLESVKLNDNIDEIGKYAFKNCKKLCSINIPAKCAEIGEGAFMNTALTSITLPQTLETINDDAFLGCTHLYIVINNSKIESIAIDSTDNGCVAKYALKVLKNSGEYTPISKGDYKLIEIDSEYYLIDYNKTATSIELPTFDDIATYKVASYLFSDNTNIINVKIPSCVTSIGDYAFNGCNNITTIDFSDATSLTSIGECAFSGTCVEQLILPEGLTSIGEKAFYNSKDLYYVSIPSTITESSISNEAFNECDLLYIVNNLSSLTLEKESTSYGCVAKYASIITENSSVDLTPNKLDAGVEFLVAGNIVIITGYDAEFNDNSTTFKMKNLESQIEELLNIDIESPVFFIKHNAFRGNTFITEVTIGKEFSSLPENVFEGCTSLVKIIFEEGSTISSIPAYAFKGCSSLTTISLPTTVTSIGEHAFEGCTSLETLEMPSKITEIKESTFEGCSALTTITLPTSLITIRKYAFKDTALQWITIPSTVTTIEDDAFANCIRLYQVNSYASTDLINSSIRGTTTSGSIGKYAIRVLDKNHTDDFDKHILQYDNDNGDHFIYLDDNWYLKSCHSATDNQLVLPDADDIPDIDESVEKKYIIYKGAIDAEGITTITIPDVVISIQNGAFINLESTGTVYYNGTEDFSTIFNGWTITIK